MCYILEKKGKVKKLTEFEVYFVRMTFFSLFSLNIFVFFTNILTFTSLSLFLSLSLYIYIYIYIYIFFSPVHGVTKSPI